MPNLSAAVRECRLTKLEQLICDGEGTNAIAAKLGVRRETVSRYLTIRAKRMMARMKDRQVALLNQAINASRDHLAKLQALIDYEIDRIFTVPDDKNDGPVRPEKMPNVPMVLAELFKVYSIVQRDMVRFSGAEQPLKHLVGIGLANAENASAIEVPAPAAINITLCDSEYGDFGKGQVKVRRLESAGTQDPTILAEASTPSPPV